MVENALRVGDRVRLIAETLAWRTEITLQCQIGEIIERREDGRITIRFDTRAPTTGSACAATFWVTTNPKRAATWVTNLRRIGAPSLMTPRSATNRAASVTVSASMPRTAKYPLSDASADPARAPKAKTSTQDRAASGA